MNVDDDDRIATPSRNSRSRAGLIALVLGLLGLGVIALVYTGRNADTPEQPAISINTAPPPASLEPPAASTPPASEPATPPVTREPVSESNTQAPPPLPALSDSDDEVRATLGDLLTPPLSDVLKPEQLIARAAVVLTNTAAGKVVRDKLPMPRPAGKFVVDERGPDELYLSPANYPRYNGLVNALVMLDARRLADWFRRYEPVFDMAYAEMGESRQSARTDLVASIDLLLNASYPTQEPALIQPAVFYKYADRALEQQPDSIKLLIRMGPQNRAKVLDWLGAFRAAL